MVQSLDGGARCGVYFDLAVDDVYLMRGIPARNEWDTPHDSVLLDATFLKLALQEGGHPLCRAHVRESGEYVHLLAAEGRSIAGSDPDSAVVTFGARYSKRFAVDPGTRRVRLAFGDPMRPSDLLVIDLDEGTVQAEAESAAFRPAGGLLGDVSAEWVAKADDPDLYFLRKTIRKERMDTAVPENGDDVRREVCTALSRRVALPYSAAFEQEPERELYRRACEGRAGAAVANLRPAFTAAAPGAAPDVFRFELKVPVTGQAPSSRTRVLKCDSPPTAVHVVRATLEQGVALDGKRRHSMFIEKTEGGFRSAPYPGDRADRLRLFLSFVNNSDDEYLPPPWVTYTEESLRREEWLVKQDPPGSMAARPHSTRDMWASYILPPGTKSIVIEMSTFCCEDPRVRVDFATRTASRIEGRVRCYAVVKGDTLWRIAKARYGDARKYPVIFEANRPMLSDPDEIYPGQWLRIPPIPVQ